MEDKFCICSHFRNMLPAHFFSAPIFLKSNTCSTKHESNSEFSLQLLTVNFRFPCFSSGYLYCDTYQASLCLLTLSSVLFPCLLCIKEIKISDIGKIHFETNNLPLIQLSIYLLMHQSSVCTSSIRHPLFQ